MKRQTWIKLRRGILDHREQMGIRIWLYLYILDRADWATGRIEDWKDDAVAEDLGMDVHTVRGQRRALAHEGYLTCTMMGHRQVVTVTNWLNPREYGGAVYNQSGRSGPLWGDASGQLCTPKDAQGGQLSPALPLVSTSKNTHRGETSISPTLVEVKKPKQGDPERKAIEEHFTKLTGIPAPDGVTKKARDEAGELWWTPLRDMLNLAGGDVGRAKKALSEAHRLATHKGQAIYTPKSLRGAYGAAIGAIAKTHAVPADMPLELGH